MLSMPSKKKGMFVLKIALSLVLLAVLTWFVDPRQMLHSMGGAERSLLILALAMAIVNRILMAIKWNILLRAIDVAI